MPINVSPNMSLPIPSVGQEAGPQYATDINNCLTLVDMHNHNPGSGVQITTSGLNINADLSIGTNNLTLIRSSRYFPQLAPLALASDLGCTYVSGVDLWFNDVNGNQIQLTSGGSIVGTAGSISGLVAPASASYSSGSSTFIWQSAANTSANMDAGSYIFRNLTANSKGVTVSAPAALGSNYSLVWPTIPGATNFVSLDTSGNFAAIWNVDNTTINFTGNNIQVAPGGITATQIANGTITTTQISATAGILGSQLSASANIVGTQLSSSANILNSQIENTNFQLSASCGAFLTGSTSGVNVTNLTVTITTEGKPVVIGLISDASGNDFHASVFSGAATTPGLSGSAELIITTTGVAPGPGSGWRFQVQVPSPVSAYNVIDFGNVGVPGTYTYLVQAAASPGFDVNVQYAKLYAYELK